MKKFWPAVFCSVILASCVSLFPKVETAAGPGASLIVLELEPLETVTTERGTHTNRFRVNTVNSGFYPVVLDPKGREVTFRLFEGSGRGGTYYYKENVGEGTYTFTGIRYLYMTHHDFITTPIKDLTFDGQRTDGWAKTEFYPLPKPVTLTVRPSKMESLGRYHFTFQTVGDTKPLDELRWKLSRFDYGTLEPDNKNSLQDIKNWRAGEWVSWNLMNDETAKP
ncbi:hypothetical protein JCM14469_38940 [Desulfatiferula olefinivorans]